MIYEKGSSKELSVEKGERRIEKPAKLKETYLGSDKLMGKNKIEVEVKKKI